MAVSKIRVSELPRATTTNGLVVLGVQSNNRSVQADMELLRGNTGDNAFELWLKLPGNIGKTYEDYLAYNRQPATDAAESVSRLEARIEQNEQERITTENNRDEAERLRNEAENLRKTTENSRKETENARVQAENSRVEVENARVIADSQREQNEDAREVAEGLRKETENARVVAENTRQTQEDERQIKTFEVINNAETATIRANEAAAQSEELNSHQPKQRIGSTGQLTWWVWDLGLEDYVDTTLPSRGPEGKGPVVLSNGNFGNWNDATGMYQDSGIEADATIDLENLPVRFNQESVSVNLVSGDTVPTAFSKIQKWYNEFGKLAWQSTVDYESEVINRPVIPDEQIQSDWNQTDDTGKDFIKNKPALKTVFAQSIFGTGDITPGTVKDIVYNGENHNFTISYFGGRENRIINMPVDNFLSEADYNPETHILSLHMSEGNDMEIHLGDLIREYHAAKNGGLEIINGNEFKISDPTREKIDRVPIHKTDVIPSSAWTYDTEYERYVWEKDDPDIALHSVVHASYFANKVDKDAYESARIWATGGTTIGKLVAYAENQPDRDINIIYTISI